jgi:hypothetical protein
MSNNNAALLAEVQRIVRDPARRLFVLADGAQFDDLPGALAAAGISCRSLYRNVQDAELVRAGPWLIDPYRQPDPTLNAWGGLPPESDAMGETAVAADTRAALQEPPAGTSFDGAAQAADPGRQLEAVIQLIGDAPAAVFWIGDAALGEAALWRHLRTLNMVMIPKEYDEAGAPPSAEDEETHEAMMFRHGDGNVLAEVMPVLDAAQFSRMFGPAKALMFMAPDHPGSDGSPVRRAVLPDAAPPAAAGMLALNEEQFAALTAQRVWKNRRFTMDYLRDAAPVETERLSDEALCQFVIRAEKSGFRIGLESDYAHGLWAFMLISFGLSIADNALITNAIRQADDPDEAVEALLTELSESAADGGDGG